MDCTPQARVGGADSASPVAEPTGALPADPVTRELLAAPALRNAGRPSWLANVLMLAHALTTLAVFAGTQWLAGPGPLGDRLPTHAVGPLDLPALLIAVMGPIAVGIVGGYSMHFLRPGNRGQLFGRLALAATLCVWPAWLAASADRTLPSVNQFVVVWLLLPTAWLLVVLMATLSWRRRPERALIIGTGPVAQRLLELARRHPEHRIEVVGFLDDEPLPLAEDGPPCHGGVEELSATVDRLSVDRVIVAFSPGGDAEILRVLRNCHAQVDVVPRLFDLAGHHPRTRSLGGLSLLSLTSDRPSRAQEVGKRLFDVGVSALILLIALPVLAAVALVVRLDDGGPALYRQKRIGRGGRTFSIIKFRTMRQGADAIPAPGDMAAIEDIVQALKLGGDAGVTRPGAFLRRTSLDELPQLWNVVRGDMSMVGPRPLRHFEVETLSDWQLSRQDVRPGITGLWQVLGRSEVRWQERMQLDFSYVRHWSFAGDLRILALSVPVVLRRRGAV